MLNLMLHALVLRQRLRKAGGVPVEVVEAAELLDRPAEGRSASDAARRV